MRKLFLLMLLLPLAAVAQHKFGYFSYSEVLEALPQYKEATENYNRLKQRCNDEIERNKLELTRNYVAFLNGQRDFPEPILRKRQKELQQLVDNSVAFRDQLKTWLAKAKDSLYAPCCKAADSAIVRVCSEMGLAYAVDTSNGAYKYINPLVGEDITRDIINAILNPSAPIRSLAKSEEEVVAAGGQQAGTEQPVDEQPVEGRQEQAAEEAAAGEEALEEVAVEHVETTDSIK